MSERALRYYQQLGLLTPRAGPPGGMRRYSEEDLARVARIRELQSLLGLNLDEIAVVLRNDDRMAEIRRATTTSGPAGPSAAGWPGKASPSEDLRATVEAKRDALDEFLADLDTRIRKARALLAGAPA